jgi:hypothetical protein
LRRTERVRVVRCWKLKWSLEVELGLWRGAERRERRAKLDRCVEVGERSLRDWRLVRVVRDVWISETWRVVGLGLLVHCSISSWENEGDAR